MSNVMAPEAAGVIRAFRNSATRRARAFLLAAERGPVPVLLEPLQELGPMTTTLFALSAEVELDLISERTREGLARARASGRKLGRP